MKNKLLVASLLALMSAAATAQTASKPSVTPAVAGQPAVAAQPAARVPTPGDMAAHQIARFDTNKDGKVSRDEFMKPAQANFKRTDLNNDGFVTAAELTEFGKRQMAEFAKMRDQATKVAPGAPASAAKPATSPAADKPAK